MLRNLIILPDGTEVSSGTSFSIKSSKLTESVNNGEELSLGAAQANMLEATLYDIGAKLSITAGDEVILYKVDEDGNRTKKGVFVLEKPTRPTANTLKLTAYDRMVKLDVDLTAWVNSLTGWPYTPLTFASMVCQQCGLTFVTASAPNADFPVHQFKKTGMTGRKIMHWLAEICCRFCRANADGNIEFGWYTPSGVTIRPTGNRYYFAGGLTYETYTVAPIEAVQIRLAESESGALWPNVESGLNSYAITGNMILNARITEDLEPYLEVIKNELAGLTYTPCRVAIPACLDVNAGNTVDIVDKNGKSITAYVMSKTSSGQRDVIECTGSARRTSTTAVNNPTADPDNSAKSISSVAVLYYLSTSSTALEGGEWSMVAPAWEDGKYIWSKTVTTYSDGTTSESDPACITGGKGADGDAGVGVSAITTQFYLSTSKTTQTGGSWVTTMPTWSTGKYLWTRSRIRYTDGTYSYTSPICDSSWEAVNDLDAKLDMEEVFNRLTNNGTIKGIYMKDGELYVNASYILSGQLTADLIKSGTLDASKVTIKNLTVDTLKLTPDGVDLYGFSSVEELNAFVESTASGMAPNTQKRFSVVLDFDPYYSTGVLTISAGYDGDAFKVAFATLSSGKYLLYRSAYSEGDNSGLFWDDEWSTVGASTASDVGAAPDGYGLGQAVLISASAIDSATAPGWYHISGSMTVNNVTANYWYMHVSAYSSGSNHCVQKLYPVSSYKVELVRFRQSGTWGEWECENPPMTAGVEYRTTERWQGNPVYIKAINFGTLPNSTEKGVYAVPENAEVISVQGYARGPSYNVPIPGYYAIKSMGVTRNTGLLWIETSTDMSSYTGYLVLKYTK